MVKVKDDLTGWIMSEHGVPDSKLTVIEQVDDYVSSQGRHSARYLCKCNCGSSKDIIAFAYDIKIGNIKSCGCLKTEKQYIRQKKYNNYDLSGEYGIGICSNSDSKFYFDLSDYDLIKEYCWSEIIDKKTGYKELKAPLLDGSKKGIHMHQLLGYDGGDHIDRNPLNNRRENLRHATITENNRNRGLFKNNTSGIMGVNFECKRNKWRSRICVNGKRIELGFFISKEEAIFARLNAEFKYYGSEFAPQRHLFKQYKINV